MHSSLKLSTHPILSLLAGLSALCFNAATAAPFAYVPNGGNRSVSVIDTANNTVVTTITTGIGQGATGVSVNPAGSRVYVGHGLENTISIINTSTNSVAGTVVVGGEPRGVVATNNRVYVANLSSNSISVIDSTNNHTVIATIPVQGAFACNPTGLAINPAGNRLYVACAGLDSIRVIDTGSNMVINTVSAGTVPFALAVNPSSPRLYVTDLNERTLRVLNTGTETVIATINLLGSGSGGVAVNPAGTRVYLSAVGDNFNSFLIVIDASTNSVIANIDVGNNTGPRGVSVNPSGSRVYVVREVGNVAVIDTANNTLIDSIPVGTQPFALGNFIGPGPEPALFANGFEEQL